MERNDPAENRTAIVTGGTRGIGAAISKTLAEANYKVMMVFRSDEKAAKEALAELQELGLDVMTFQADVGVKAQAEGVAEAALRKWGRIDALVNNAGIFDFAFLDEITEEYFDNMVRSNLKSVIFMSQAVLPQMKKQKHGRIVNASSISGKLADVGLITYGFTKSGVDMFTRIGSAELAPYGITVNTYAPGIIHTDMTDAMIKERGDRQLTQIPAARFGSGADVASLIRFLCSEEAGYITGEIIGVDGGMLKVQNPQRAYEHAGLTDQIPRQ
jgi:3-oxoacyl-[acyl-carrier protein] reductase